MRSEASQRLFTQEEVNAMVSKRLKREKKQVERQVEAQLLEKEVLGILRKENIPTSLSQFVISSKGEKQTAIKKIKIRIILVFFY